jgi:hypothetical protein
MKEIIERLKNDEDYYGEYGKQWLSNSQIGTLLRNPKEFGKDSDLETANLLLGRFFHVAMIEPHKLGEFEIVDASSRNTKIYKEQADDRFLLLQKEVDHLMYAILEMKGNKEMANQIYAKGNQYEVPMVDNFYGVPFKGKADIVTKDKIIDIKTTSNIDKFRQSAKMYNYDSQAFIYSSMFGLPFEFFVIDKNTRQMGIYTCSEEFLDRGMQKVAQAVEVYNKFFGPNATEDVKQYVAHEVL